MPKGMSEAVSCLPQVAIIPDDPRPGRRIQNRGLAQAYDLRDFAAEEAMRLRQTKARSLRDKALKAQALKALGNVWSDASDRIRILRGRPLPGSLKPQPRVRTKPAALPPPTESA